MNGNGSIAFRVDASAQMGVGHVMRCLALADALKGVGARSHFISRQLPDYLHQAVLGKGHELALLGSADAEAVDDLPHAAWLGTSQRRHAQQSLQALSGKKFDWLVVDHYALDARWETALRQSAARVMAIDDLADRAHDCDLLLDPGAPADAKGRYDGKVPAGSRLLLGPRYALLREEFRELHEQAKPRAGHVKRVLVFLGGVDAKGHTINVLDALQGLKDEGLIVDVVIGSQNPSREKIESRCRTRGFSCHVQTDRMAELMSAADLAIGSGGSATWERCCLGLPALTLCIADNQRQLIAECALQGLVYAPDLRPEDADSIAAHVRALLDNPLLLQQISRNSLRAVDGRGVQRVLRAMGFGRITIREARPADSSRILAWRNHPDVRKSSATPDPISPATHEKWFAAVLADADRLLLLGEHGEEAVGVVRFDIADGEAEVSIYLAPGLSGEGRGSGLLQAAESWLTGNRPDVRSMRAQVLHENTNSHGLFAACGYRKRSTLYAKEVGRT